MDRGNGSSFPVDVFKEIGLVDNINFPQYYGDADFSLRASDAGFKIYCHSDLKLMNDGIQLVSQWFFIEIFSKSIFSKISFNLKVHIKLAFKYFHYLLLLNLF